MPEVQALYNGAKSSLRDRVLGEIEKKGFIALPGKGGHSGLMPVVPLMCPILEGLGLVLQ